MKAKSVTEDFGKRLKELTDALYIGFITLHRTKPFRGTFDKSSFELIRNSHWKHIRSISITGTFRKNADGTTEVDYEVGVSKRYKTVALIFFLVTLTGLNVFLFVHSGSLTESMFFTLNGFWCFAFLWAHLITRIGKKIVDERFRTEFEIVED